MNKMFSNTQQASVRKDEINGRLPQLREEYQKAVEVADRQSAEDHAATKAFAAEIAKRFMDAECPTVNVELCRHFRSGAEVQLCFAGKDPHDTFSIRIEKYEDTPDLRINYNAWSQSGNNANDARETADYYSRVAQALAWTADPANADLLEETVKNATLFFEERSAIWQSVCGSNRYDLEREIKSLEGELREIELQEKLVEGAVVRVFSRRYDCWKKVAVKRVTAKRFVYAYIEDNGSEKTWTETASIDGGRIKFITEG